MLNSNPTYGSKFPADTHASIKICSRLLTMALSILRIWKSSPNEIIKNNGERKTETIFTLKFLDFSHYVADPI